MRHFACIECETHFYLMNTNGFVYHVDIKLKNKKMNVVKSNEKKRNFNIRLKNTKKEHYVFL